LHPIILLPTVLLFAMPELTNSGPRDERAAVLIADLSRSYVFGAEAGGPDTRAGTF